MQDMPGQALHHACQDSRCAIPALARGRANTGQGSGC